MKTVPYNNKIITFGGPGVSTVGSYVLPGFSPSDCQLVHSHAQPAHVSNCCSEDSSLVLCILHRTLPSSIHALICTSSEDAGHGP